MTAEVFIKFQVRAFLDSKNLSHGPYLTGVVMNNKRSFTGRGEGRQTPSSTKPKSILLFIKPSAGNKLSVCDQPVTHKRKGSTKLQANFKWTLIEVTRRELSVVRVSYNSNKQSSLRNYTCIPKKRSTCQVSGKNIKVPPAPHTIREEKNAQDLFLLQFNFIH